VNDQVDGVVSNDVVFAKIPVEGKSQVCYGPVELIFGRPGIFRLGEKGVDQGKIVEIIQRVSQLVSDLPMIQEIDLNPIIAYEDRVVVVDARIRI
jgi:acyl-CoA synthetase (NDP forming)